MEQPTRSSIRNIDDACVTEQQFDQRHTRRSATLLLALAVGAWCVMGGVYFGVSGALDALASL